MTLTVELLPAVTPTVTLTQPESNFSVSLSLVQIGQKGEVGDVNPDNIAYAAAAEAAADSAEQSAASATADRVQTGLDAIATAADRVQTGLDAATASTQAGVASTKASEAAASKDAADADAVATAADRVQTGLDKTATAADRTQTGIDAAATADDRVQTGLDKTATAADRTQTGIDAAATAADRVQTGLDAATATTKASIATTKASEAAASKAAADADAVATSADRAQTGIDKLSAAASASDAATAKAIAEAARDQTLAAFDSFDDRYLGAKSSDPIADNDGNPLVGGALYFNTAPLDNGGGMRVYDGTEQLWRAAYASLTGALLSANNLNDLSNKATARTNLGLGNVDNTSDANKPVSTAAATALAGKQATLVSGTNIKTINGLSVLGGGNITLRGLDGFIGVQGSLGFGVGICPGTLPSGFTPMSGYDDRASDNYGNYQYSDGSVMPFIPKFYYRIGSSSSPRYATYGANAIDVEGTTTFVDETAANAAGYALHRAFYDGGKVQPGFFFDKYITSNNGGIASSLRNGIVLTSGQRGSLSTAVYSALTGAPANNLGGSFAAAKTRGSNFFAASQFQRAALALLSLAHAQASTSTTYCAWYDATNNFPKGNNNNALGDVNDGAILYVADGNGTYPGCGKTGSANLFARTTHNGQNSGIADLNGIVWEYSPGLTSDGTNIYLLKTSVAMKSLTGGNSLATDAFGSSGLSANYTSIGATYQSLTKANGWVTTGHPTNQVLSAATSGTDWAMAGQGIPLTAGIGGSNAFGNDGVYQPSAWPAELAPLSGGAWDNGSVDGVWALGLDLSRASSYSDLGFRSALYL